MIFSRFGTRLTLIDKENDASGNVRIVRATTEGSPEMREYRRNDLMADNGMPEIDAIAQAAGQKIPALAPRVMTNDSRDVYRELFMSQQRIIGVILLVVGVGLFVVGMNSSHSAADQISKTFTGRFTEATTWYILGGIVAGVTGILMLLAGRGKGA